MDERIDELTNGIANKIDLHMDDYLIETFALLRRMTQTTYTSRLFNSLGNIKYEILGILRKHFSKVYDEIKQTNDPSRARRLHVERIVEEIDDLIIAAIRKGLNRLEYELPEILRDNFRGINRDELRRQEYLIMNRVPEYFNDFRLAARRYSNNILEEAREEFIKLANKNFEQKEKEEEKIEIIIDPKVEEILSRISRAHFKVRNQNNKEEQDKYILLRTRLEIIAQQGQFIDDLKESSKEKLNNMVNEYLELTRNILDQNGKFKPMEEKPNKDETLKPNQEEIKETPTYTIDEYIKKIDELIEQHENETKRSL